MEHELTDNVSKYEHTLGKDTDFLVTNDGKFITFNNDKYFISDNFQSAVEKGISEFGTAVGFMVREISKTGKHPQLSSPVKEL